MSTGNRRPVAGVDPGVSGRGPDRHRGAAVALSRHRCRAAGGRRRQRRHPVLLGHPGRPNGTPLILQIKEATRSVLEEYGGWRQPDTLTGRRRGEGPGCARRRRAADPAGDVGCVPRHDTQGRPRLLRPSVPRHEGHRRNRGMSASTFSEYVTACAVLLARAHSQSANASILRGYVGTSDPCTTRSPMVVHLRRQVARRLSPAAGGG